MPVRVVSSRSSQPLTVNALIRNPLIVPERIARVLDNQFATDQVLRNAGKATGGAVQFRVASGLYADDASEIVEEFSEIPAAAITRGDLQSQPVKKRGLAVLISREMRERNNMGEVDRQITMVRNTIVRDVDGAFIDTLLGAAVQTETATDEWDVAATATIRRDINAARRKVKLASSGTDSYFGYEPDTLLISPLAEEALLNSDEFLTLVRGGLRDTNVASLADIGTVLGLRPLVSLGVPDDVAIVTQSKVVGGYADEFPLESTELYEWRPNQTWRSDTTRSTTGFIDNPEAACVIEGILTP